MRVSISDTAPGSGPARTTYLEARIRRVLEPYSSRITSVELKLELEETVHEGVLVLRMRGSAPFMFTTKGRRMTDILANLIGAGEARLAVEFPSSRVQEEAI